MFAQVYSAELTSVHRPRQSAHRRDASRGEKKITHRVEYIQQNNFNLCDESPCWLWVAVYCTKSAWWIVCWNVYVMFACLRQVRVKFVCTGLPLTPSQHCTHTHTHTHTHTCTHVCYIEPLGSDGSKIDSDSQSFWFWFTHTHTHTHAVWSYAVMYCLQRGFGHRGDGFVFFFSDGTLQHTEIVTHTTWSGQSRETQREQTGQNLGHADSQVVEQFLPVRQYSRSHHDFHRTFYTGFHLSMSGKCVTGRKTLGFFVNHVNIVLLRCPPLQAIAIIPLWSGE